MENMRKTQKMTAPEILLPKEQEQETSDLMKNVMEDMDQREREQMAAFLRGVRFAKALDAR